MGRSVGIIPSIQEAVITYLAERDRYLRRHHQPDAAPLIPYCPRVRHRRVRYYHPAEWSKLKKRIQEVAGLRFKWKDFRSTFTQTCIENGAKNEAVSRLLGYSSTKITETYYVRIRNDKAMEEVAQALEKRAIPILVEPLKR
jgi:integrase